MKKILVVVFVLIASYGYAQDLKFGAKAGLNLSNIVGDDVKDVDMKTGLYFGGFLNVPLNTRQSIQVELLYSRQGWKVEEESAEETLKLSYLNIPLLFRQSLGASNKIHFYSGPQLGFLLDAEADYEDEFGSDTEDVDDYINNIDFSLNLGFSIVVSDNMSLDLRYNKGLSKVLDFDDEDIKAYNSSFQVGVSYLF